MILIHFLFALTISLLLVALFSASFRRDDEGWLGIGLIFFLIFLASWTGGIWITPFGPPIWGVAWMPFLLMGLVFALLIAASGGLSNGMPSATARGDAAKDIQDQDAAEALSVFIWVLFALLLIGIFTRYLWITTPLAY